MSRSMRPLLIAGFVGAACILPAAQQTQLPTPDAYQTLASGLETRLRYVTELSVPDGPTLQVKVYDWIIGPRHVIERFPLEGFATFEVKSGEVDVKIGDETVTKQAGESFVVPEGARVGLAVRPEAGRGDNLVSLRGVVAIRR